MIDDIDDAAWSFDVIVLEEESYKDEPNMSSIVVTILEEITSLRNRVAELEKKLEKNNGMA